MRASRKAKHGRPAGLLPASPVHGGPGLPTPAPRAVVVVPHRLRLGRRPRSRTAPLARHEMDLPVAPDGRGHAARDPAAGREAGAGEGLIDGAPPLPADGVVAAVDAARRPAVVVVPESAVTIGDQ